MLQTVFLTAFFTILPGVIIYVSGQIFSKFFIDPIHVQREIIGEIEDALIFYRNVYSNPGVLPKEKNDEASARLRQLSTLLRSKTHRIPWYWFFEKLKMVLKFNDINGAAKELIGLSNTLSVKSDANFDTVQINNEHEKKIVKFLNLTPSTTIGRESNMRQIIHKLLQKYVCILEMDKLLEKDKATFLDALVTAFISWILIGLIFLGLVIPIVYSMAFIEKLEGSEAADFFALWVLCVLWVPALILSLISIIFVRAYPSYYLAKHKGFSAIAWSFMGVLQPTIPILILALLKSRVPIKVKTGSDIGEERGQLDSDTTGTLKKNED